LVTGVVKGGERETIFNAVRDGNAEVLVATTPADEGLHPPPPRSLVVALGCKGRTRTLQRISGLVRPYPGKDVAIAFNTGITPSSSISRRARKKLYENEPHWRIEVVEMRRKR
jgi:superfamily II DNA or RNA helicase